MTATCHHCNSPVCHEARFCPNCGSTFSNIGTVVSLLPEHEQRIVHLIEKLGDNATLVYNKPKPYTKKNLSAIRYNLIIDGITVADQIRRVYWHYAQVGDLELAVKEADKVKDDLVDDRKEGDGRPFYELIPNPSSNKAKL
jgi:hypothetical protein